MDLNLAKQLLFIQARILAQQTQDVEKVADNLARGQEFAGPRLVKHFFHEGVNVGIRNGQLGAVIEIKNLLQLLQQHEYLVVGER